VRQRGAAKALADAGRAHVNGAAAKASHEVRAGDRLRLDLANGALEVRVLEVPEGNVARRDKARYVEILSEPAAGSPAATRDARDTIE
jgi:ribosomal 50S subunit-recycling heat shock protein